jgi:hypothetical protein
MSICAMRVRQNEHGPRETSLERETLWQSARIARKAYSAGIPRSKTEKCFKQLPHGMVWSTKRGVSLTNPTGDNSPGLASLSSLQ